MKCNVLAILSVMLSFLGVTQLAQSLDPSLQALGEADSRLGGNDTNRDC